MTWFKVDDKLHDHRKARVAKKAAMGVWVLAGSWSMDNLTDGFIPADVLTRWGNAADAKALVAAGLWFADERGGEKGWAFHDWDRFQPSAAVTAAVRAKEAEAGVRGNHQRWHVNKGVNDPLCEYCHRVPDPEPDRVPEGTPDAAPESPPIPPEPESPPIPPVPVPVPVPDHLAAPSEGPRKRAHALPADWQPSDAHRALAAERGVDPDLEATKMRDWAAAEGKTGKDWDARFRNWLRTARPDPRAAKPDTRLANEPIAQPPDGLTDEQMWAWHQQQRAKRNSLRMAAGGRA